MKEDNITEIQTNGVDIFTDITEVFLDQIIENDIVSNIPILGIVTKLYRSGKSIREQHFLNNLMAFLKEMSSIPTGKKKLFLKDNLETQKDKLNIGSKILLLIEKSDEEIKAIWYADILKCYINSSINQNEFYDLLYSAERLKVHYALDLFELINFGFRSKPREMVDHFYSCGFLISQPGISSGLESDSMKGYSVSNIGKLFLSLVYIPDISAAIKRFINHIITETPKKREETSRTFILKEEFTINEIKLYLSELPYEDLIKIKVRKLGTELDNKKNYYLFKNGELFCIYKRE